MRAAMVGLGLAACADPMPEIWIDRSPIELGAIAPGDAVDFGLQIANDGDGTLELQPFALRGDDDCAFWLEGPDEMALTGPMQSFIRGRFAPRREGLHQVALYLSSNAVTLPTLIVPICAVVGADVTVEELVVCEEPPTDAANCTQ
ncbi:MAG: hypothetical protein AAF211_09555 [Myxococcota bacterium]